LELSDIERGELERLVRRHKTAQALALRARIILLAADGLTNTAIAMRLGVDLHRVGRSRQRFAGSRVDGLFDEPRPGAPRKIGDEAIAETIRRTLESRPEGATHWSLRSMATVTGYAPSTIHRIWRAFGLQPHRTETFKLSTDPLFGVDPVRWDTFPLEGGAIDAEESPTLCAKVLAWLARHPRWTFHFTPTSASWLNAVENFFSKMTRQRIRRGVFRSIVDLQTAINAYLAEHNANPKPFVWTKSAEAILAKFDRLPVTSV
jgi:transposase